MSQKILSRSNEKIKIIIPQKFTLHNREKPLHSITESYNRKKKERRNFKLFHIIV